LFAQNESQLRESKFMAENLKRISDDKIQMEKRNKELQRLTKKQ
jgi:hypothetical protein